MLHFLSGHFLVVYLEFGSGGGSCFPSMVVVALGEPGSPVVSVRFTEAGIHHRFRLLKARANKEKRSLIQEVTLMISGTTLRIGPARPDGPSTRWLILGPPDQKGYTRNHRPLHPG